MKPPKYWIRICVDVDPALNPIGSSYEVHSADDLVSLVVRAADGPFDSASDVFGYCLDDVVSRHGVPLTLF